jgi:hypothetical protein
MQRWIVQAGSLVLGGAVHLSGASEVLRASFIRNRRCEIQAENLSAERAFALAASSSRFLGGALVSSDCKSRIEMPEISSTAARNKASLAFDGLLKPLIFLTNCREEARTSASFTGGSKLNRVLMFLHIWDDLLQ